MTKEEIKKIVLSSVGPKRYPDLLASFEKIKDDLEKKGVSKKSPIWDCSNCEVLFPKTIKEEKCPCHVGYKPSYLILRVKLFISILEEKL